MRVAEDVEPSSAIDRKLGRLGAIEIARMFLPTEQSGLGGYRENGDPETVPTAFRRSALVTWR
jgi:hypothetical protein